MGLIKAYSSVRDDVGGDLADTVGKTWPDPTAGAGSVAVNQVFFAIAPTGATSAVDANRLVEGERRTYRKTGASSWVDLGDRAAQLTRQNAGSLPPSGPTQLALDALGEKNAYRREFEIDGFIAAGVLFSTALSMALSAAQDEDGVVIGTPGRTYVATQPVTWAGPIRFDLRGASIVRAASAPDASVLKVAHPFTLIQPVLGFAASTATLTIDAVYQNARITLGNTAGYFAGDIVKLVSDDIIPWSPGEKQAESVRIIAVDAANGYLYTDRPLYFTYSTNPRIGRFTPLACDIPNFVARDEPGYPSNRAQPMLWLNGVVSPTLTGARFSDTAGEALFLESCWQARTDDMRFARLRTKSDIFAYGYGIRENGTVGSLHTNLYGEDLRHVHTTGAFNSLAANDSRFEKYGGAIGWKVCNSVAVRPTDEGFSSHPDAYLGVYENCSTRDAVRGSITVRGKACEIKSCSGEGVGGVTLASRENGGDHVVSGYTHRRRAGFTQSAAVLNVTHDGAVRTTAKINGFVADLDSQYGTPFVFTGAVVRGDVQIRQNAIETAAANTSFKTFSLTNADVRLRGLVDFSGSPGDAQPRMVEVNDASCVFIGDGLEVKAGGKAWRGADFKSGFGYAATVILDRLKADLAPLGPQAPGSSSVFWSDAEIANGIGTQPAVQVFNSNATSDLAISTAYRGERDLVIDYTSTGSAGTRNLSFVNPPLRPTQRLTVINRAASTKTLTLPTTSAMPLSASIVINAGSIAQFAAAGGLWVRVS